MTSVCTAGGPSRAKDLTNPVVVLSVSAIAALISKFKFTWAQALGFLVGQFTIDLGPFCAGEPPADPGFTAADAIAMYNITDYNGQLAANAKLRQLIQRFAWYEFCECTSGTQPTAPSAPAAPSGLPVTSPPSLPGALAVPCRADPIPLLAVTGTQTFNRNGMVFGGLGATSLRYTFTNAVNTSGGPDVQWRIDFRDPFHGNVLRRQLNLPMVTPQTFTGTTPIFPDETSIIPVLTAQGGAGLTDTSGLMELFCGNDVPGTADQACCPPDPMLQGMLQQILTLVTLIQRQAAPFAYIDGASHPGLSGDGGFDVQGILGVAIDITTLPSSYGLASGTPEELFGLGYVALGTADGHVHAARVEFDKTLVLPPQAGVYTTVGYTLSPGVVATIKELVREP